ncbi:MAG: DUF177 domain-containing protein [Alphaproteobacteria bacterium]|nr:DUF177 domain-containing protein [Alphaproteobacteria bacterium]
MSEDEAISAPFGEAEMSLLVLHDEVPPNGREIEHVANDDVLAALAKRFKVEEVADLIFEALLTPLASDCLQVSGKVRGKVRQLCGVTLDPLWTQINIDFSTEFQPQELVAKYVVPEDDFDTELPEAMQNGQADIGEMVTQVFAMEIPAYPRAEDAEFVGYGQSEAEREAEDAKQSPFAALSALKASNDTSDET